MFFIFYRISPPRCIPKNMIWTEPSLISHKIYPPRCTQNVRVGLRHPSLSIAFLRPDGHKKYYLGWDVLHFLHPDVHKTCDFTCTILLLWEGPGSWLWRPKSVNNRASNCHCLVLLRFSDQQSSLQLELVGAPLEHITTVPIKNQTSNWNLCVLLSRRTLLFRSTIEHPTVHFWIPPLALFITFPVNNQASKRIFWTPLARITTLLVNNWTSNYNFLVLLSHRSLLLCSTMEPPNVTFWYSSRTDHHFSG